MTAGEEATTGEGGAAAGPTDDGPEPLGPVRRPAGRIRLKWAGQVLAVALVVGGLGTLLTRGIAWLPVWVGPGVGVAIAALGLVWVLLRYRAWSFRLRSDALYLERGVLTHVETVVPHVRIQHVDTSRGPVDRVLGLSTLVVYTAGSRGADVAIPGLTTEEAGTLQTRVKELAIEAEGGDAL